MRLTSLSAALGATTVVPMRLRGGDCCVFACILMAIPVRVGLSAAVHAAEGSNRSLWGLLQFDAQRCC